MSQSQSSKKENHAAATEKLSDISESRSEGASSAGEGADKEAVDARQEAIQEAIAQLVGPTEMSPEVMFQLEDLEKDMKAIRAELDRFREVVATLQDLKVE